MKKKIKERSFVSIQALELAAWLNLSMGISLAPQIFAGRCHAIHSAGSK
jgi:hypothetical protein